MAGGLMQLVAYGAQDVYLTGNPKVTFFQAVYKRHTNFALEVIQQTVNGTAGNDGRVSVTIARNGDLIGDMYVELKTKSSGLVTSTAGTISTTFDTNWVAERAIKDVELSIGGQRIDKHYQLWWRLYSELYLNSDKKDNYAKLTTCAQAHSGQVFLPLLFFFNRNPGLYLPLIALQYHEVRLDFDLSSYFASYLDTSVFNVWGNYVYLDTEERRRFAQKGHEYLIDQVQHTGADSVTSGGTSQVRLSYNHPVKELVWCYTKSQTSGPAMWNFTSNAGTLNSVVLESNVENISTIADGNSYVLSSTSKATGVPMVLSGVNVAGSVSKVSTCQWLEEGTPSATMSAGPVSTFKLILNGQDRFKEQSGKYFNQMEPFMHHSGCPYPGVYSYSFALKPEEHQPTGTCNFSRIDNAQVQIVNKSTTMDNTSQWMFAVNYNVLRIQSGMGGLAFSN